ncbi:sugar phosphate nucleotidyltransferase [Nonomuraea ferruginea]
MRSTRSSTSSSSSSPIRGSRTPRWRSATSARSSARSSATARAGGLSVDFTEELAPLSTIGPLFPIRDRLPEHFLVMNGDVLTTLNYADLLARHVASAAPLTVATSPRVVKIDFGVLEASGGRIVGFREKPLLSYLVSMGVYALSRDTIAHYPEGMPFGFGDLVLDLLARNRPPGIYEFDGYWLDIGRPDDYDEANARFDEIRPQLLPSRDPVR